METDRDRSFERVGTCLTLVLPRLAQGALLACALTLGWGAWRARGIDEDRLRLDIQSVLRVHRVAAGHEALDKLSRLAARATARDAATAIGRGALDADGAGDVAGLLRDTGLLDANGAPVQSAEHNLRLWLANQLARGHFRGLDADAPFPLPGDVAEAPPRPASDAIIR